MRRVFPVLSGEFLVFTKPRVELRNPGQAKEHCVQLARVAEAMHAATRMLRRGNVLKSIAECVGRVCGEVRNLRRGCGRARTVSEHHHVVVLVCCRHRSRHQTAGIVYPARTFAALCTDVPCGFIVHALEETISLI